MHGLTILSINKNLHIAGSLHDDTRAYAQCMAMAERVAQALSLLGADHDLLGSADTEALLELIDEYLAGIAPPVSPTL